MWTDFVDKVFVINTIERPDRLIEITKQLNSFGITFDPISTPLNENGVQGLKDAMKLLFCSAISSKYERLCCFEDDANIVRQNFNELMQKCIDQLPDDFDLFYMGGNVWKQPIRKSSNILQVPSMYATHSVIYSKKAIEYILDHMDNIMRYDELLVKTIQRLNKCYCSFPLLVSQKDGYSDIKKKDVKYKKFIELRYDEKTNGI